MGVGTRRMKKFILSFFLLILGLSAVFVVCDRSLAQTDRVVATSEVSETVVHAGLWRDGKALFSDIKLFDLFLPERYRRGYQPEQPVHYSHRLHVEKNGIECQYCHSGVNKSSFATIPSLETCMGCHKTVKQDSPQIQILKKHWDDQKPVEWVPVNNLPEHVNFNHQRHVKAGVGCQNCHGQVEKMEVVEKVASFKMGFCISCHRDKGATIDCGACHY